MRESARVEDRSCSVFTASAFAVALGPALHLSFLLAPPAHAAFPGANGKIVFHTYPGEADPSYRLHTIEPNGSGRTPLFVGQDAAWSADGQKLAFTRIHDVYTARPDGSDLFRVTQRGCDQFTCTDSYAGSWSPDRNRLALTNVFSVEPQGSVLYIGDQRRRIGRGFQLGRRIFRTRLVTRRQHDRILRPTESPPARLRAATSRTSPTAAIRAGLRTGRGSRSTGLAFQACTGSGS